jgi:hypothetical protein
MVIGDPRRVGAYIMNPRENGGHSLEDVLRKGGRIAKRKELLVYSREFFLIQTARRAVLEEALVPLVHETKSTTVSQQGDGHCQESARRETCCSSFLSKLVCWTRSELGE